MAGSIILLLRIALYDNINDVAICRMDMELDLIEECYATFHQYHIDVPKDDNDMVYGLRYAFQNMLLTVSFQGKNPFFGLDWRSYFICLYIYRRLSRIHGV